MSAYRTFLAAVFGLTTLTFNVAPAQARDASDYSPQELVEALVQRFSRSLLAGPSRNSPGTDTAIVLLEGKALSLEAHLQPTPTLRILPLADLVAEQRAVFLIISQLGRQGPDIFVDYEIPNNASYGTLRISDQDGKLVFTAKDSFRSSSGSRATYARLYGGVACRNGSEMAYRYNFYARNRESGKCPFPTFPESPFEW